MPRRSTPIRQWPDNRMLELIKQAKRPVVVGDEAVDVDLSATDLETIRKRVRDMADEEPATISDRDVDAGQAVLNTESVEFRGEFPRNSVGKRQNNVLRRESNAAH